MSKVSQIKLYAASRVRRAPAWIRLRNHFGWNIISTWIDEAELGDTDDFSELWSRILGEIQQCDALMLYIEPGDFPLKGSLVEVGAALALGKPVAVVAPGLTPVGRTYSPIGSWIEHPQVRTFFAHSGDTLIEAHAWLALAVHWKAGSFVHDVLTKPNGG